MSSHSFTPSGYKFLLLVVLLATAVDLTAQPLEFKHADFDEADSIASLYPKHALTDLKVLSEKLTASLSTDVEKFRAIYRWVSVNIENDYTLFMQNKRRREKLRGNQESLKDWNSKFGKRVVRKLLNDHSTVCTGYAYLVKELAYYADIECVIIDGYGRTVQANIGGPGYVNHSWNAVKLNEQWLLCDPTWSSGEVNAKEEKFVPQFTEGYFLAEPALFVLNHYPVDTSWILLDEKPTLEDFLNGPLIYKTALIHNILPQSPVTFNNIIYKGEKLKIQFSKLDSEPLEEVQLELVQGKVIKSVAPEVQQNADGSFTMEYEFRRKGQYAVHVLVNGDYVFTYDVRVVK